MIYLVCFFTSALCFRFSESLLKHKKTAFWFTTGKALINIPKKEHSFKTKITMSQALSGIFALLGLLIPSILAGVRDFSIGTDITVYGNAWFERAHHIGLLKYLRWAVTSSIGLIYALLNYIVGLFTEDAHIFYFILMLVELTLVYKAVTYFRDKLSVPLAMLVYYFLFYNTTLNILRQSLALAIMAVAIANLARNRNKQFLLFWLIASLAHSSALLMIVLFPIKIYSLQKEKRFHTLVLFSVTSVTMILYSQILGLLIHFGILSERYAVYLGDIAAGGRMTRTAFFFIITILLLIGYPAFEKSYRKEIVLINSTIISSALTLILFFGNNQIIRIAYYFDLSLLFILPMLNRIIVFDFFEKKAKWLHIPILILLFVYWLITVVVQRGGETYPFKMM